MQHCLEAVWQSLGCGAEETVQIHFLSGNRTHTSQEARTRGICGFGDQTSAEGVCICWKRIVEQGATGSDGADLLPVHGIAFL